MASNRLTLAALGIACVTAAAAGGYVATRHNVADHAATTVSAAGTSANAAATGAPVATPQSSQKTTSVSTRTVQTPAAAPSTPRPTDTPQQRPSTARTASSQAPVPAPTARAEQPEPALDRGMPVSVAAAPVVPPVPEPSVVARNDDHWFDAPKPVEPPEPTVEELTVAADSVVGLRTETALSSERARVEDRVEARVVRDVRVAGRIAIPAGTRVLGSVVVVERGGKMRDRARLGIRFNTLALADGTRLPISTETIYRYGDAPGNGSAAKIGGGAVAGAILGAIIGGGKGAAIGATTGAAGGGAAVMASDRSEALFPSGAEVTARFLAPVSVTVER
jgi:hypothetical protein